MGISSADSIDWIPETEERGMGLVEEISPGLILGYSELSLCMTQSSGIQLKIINICQFV